jgi:hypothetical protein
MVDTNQKKKITEAEINVIQDEMEKKKITFE